MNCAISLLLNIPVCKENKIEKGRDGIFLKGLLLLLLLLLSSSSSSSSLLLLLLLLLLLRVGVGGNFPIEYD